MPLIRIKKKYCNGVSHNHYKCYIETYLVGFVCALATGTHWHGETSPGVRRGLLMMNSRGGSRPPPQSQTNIYFLRVTPPVSWVHIEFLTTLWRCLWKVITYWMFSFFIQLLEGKIYLLRPQIVWRNHVSSSPQTQPFTSTSKQVEQHGISVAW